MITIQVRKTINLDDRKSEPSKEFLHSIVLKKAVNKAVNGLCFSNDISINIAFDFSTGGKQHKPTIIVFYDERYTAATEELKQVIECIGKIPKEFFAKTTAVIPIALSERQLTAMARKSAIE